MAAYVIADVQVTDQALMGEYRQLVDETIAAYGGKYAARGGLIEAVEGDWNPGRVVIIEFESMERAKAWYSSDEYRSPKALRHKAARTNMILVEGV